MKATKYRGWTITHVGVSWYTYAPDELVDFRHGVHHSSRDAARRHVRQCIQALAERSETDVADMQAFGGGFGGAS